MGGYNSVIIKLSLTLFLVLAGCSIPSDESDEVLPDIQPPQLSKKPEYNVIRDTLELKVSGTGKLMSSREEKLYFLEDNKRVLDVYIEAGDAVKQGQLLAELEPGELESQIRQKEIQLEIDELDLKEKLRSGSITSDVLMQKLKLDMELKQAELEKLKDNLAKTKLYAPYDGTITTVSIKKGDLIRSYQEVAFIADLSTLKVAAKLSADDLLKVVVGMEATVDINLVGSHKGIVERHPIVRADTSNTAEDDIADYLVVQLERMPEVTRGTPLTVTIITERKTDVVLIPSAALRSFAGRNYVQMIDEQGARGEVDVEVGLQTATEVEIIKGLQPGQKVVGK